MLKNYQSKSLLIERIHSTQ